MHNLYMYKPVQFIVLNSTVSRNRYQIFSLIYLLIPAIFITSRLFNLLYFYFIISSASIHFFTQQKMFLVNPFTNSIKRITSAISRNGRPRTDTKFSNSISSKSHLEKFNPYKSSYMEP